jgi:hypothetical protein
MSLLNVPRLLQPVCYSIIGASKGTSQILCDEHAGDPMGLQHQDQDEVHHALDQGQPARGLGIY